MFPRFESTAMKSLAQFLKQKAMECLKQANDAATEAERGRWLKMARLFQHQAEQFGTD
jgi:hypothetical protein